MHDRILVVVQDSLTGHYKLPHLLEEDVISCATIYRHCSQENEKNCVV